MPRKGLPATDPNEWLRRARSNLARAKSRIPEASSQKEMMQGRAHGSLTVYGPIDHVDAAVGRERIVSE
jgi:hypothetical protein